jgi:hypothetical protein
VTAPAADPGDRARVGFATALRAARDSDGSRLLSDIVGANLRHMWEHGGRLAGDGPARRPEWIQIRSRFVVRPPADGPDPALSRLVNSKGLQLRLLLLMLFDAQCRYGLGDTVRNVRWVSPHPNEEYRSWRQLVLCETMRTRGTGRGHGDLRARQITEAMRALEEQRLLWLPRQSGGKRRRYDPAKDGENWHLLSEASTAEEHPRYILPTTEASFRVSPLFFTNLWIFALTDTELAAYLTLAFLRTQFSARHWERGVYLRAENREDQFRLTRTAWRATELLHRFRLVDREPDPLRNFRTGNVGNRDERWKNRQVRPALFRINDAALERPALDAIHQVVTAPTEQDQLRREKGQRAVDEAIAAGLLA